MAVSVTCTDAGANNNTYSSFKLEEIVPGEVLQQLCFFLAV
eukprot:COSAG02_NODE_1246_length_13659_cov_23.906858_4_plen_41_part_00